MSTFTIIIIAILLIIIMGACFGLGYTMSQIEMKSVIKGNEDVIEHLNRHINFLVDKINEV